MGRGWPINQKESSRENKDEQKKNTQKDSEETS